MATPFLVSGGTLGHGTLGPRAIDAELDVNVDPTINTTVMVPPLMYTPPPLPVEYDTCKRKSHRIIGNYCW